MKEPLKEFIKRVVEEVAPDKIILFGSRVKFDEFKDKWFLIENEIVGSGG